MTDTAIFAELFNSRAVLTPLATNKRGKTFLLEEVSGNYETKIRDVPDDSVVIKLDDSFTNTDIFKGSKGECKRADFILLSERKKCIICIELKKDVDDKKEVIRQLKGASCFIDYCRSVGQTFWYQKTFLENYHLRFVAFFRLGLRKRPTVHRRSPQKHNTPEDFLCVNSAAQISFNEIAELK